MRLCRSSSGPCRATLLPDARERPYWAKGLNAKSRPQPDGHDRPLSGKLALY